MILQLCHIAREYTQAALVEPDVEAKIALFGMASAVVRKQEAITRWRGAFATGVASLRMSDKGGEDRTSEQKEKRDDEDS